MSVAHMHKNDVAMTASTELWFAPAHLYHDKICISNSCQHFFLLKLICFPTELTSHLHVQKLKSALQASFQACKTCQELLLPSKG